jgi:hypothetical protein
VNFPFKREAKWTLFFSLIPVALGLVALVIVYLIR